MVESKFSNETSLVIRVRQWLRLVPRRYGNVNADLVLQCGVHFVF